ncbi:MAG: DUF3822 family protein [Bacteroidota bacterium]
MYQEFLQYEVKDPQMDVNLLSQYQLTIKVSDAGVVILVSSVTDKKCLALEKHKFTTPTTSENLSINLQNVWTSHSFLNAGYWNNVMVIFSNLKFAYVPTQYINEPIKPELFTQYNFQISERETLNSYQIDEVDATCFFAVNNDLFKWFEEIYPTPITKMVHETSMFIKSLLNTETKSNHIYINISDSIITLINIKEKVLYYVNSFHFSSAEDILYTCSLVMDELNLDRREAQLNIWGDIKNNDQTFNTLKAYFPEVVAGKRPAGVNFSFNFDEIEEHIHFDLFNTIGLNV